MPEVLITKPRAISYLAHFEIATAGFVTGEPGVIELYLCWAYQQATSYNFKHGQQELNWGLAYNHYSINPDTQSQTIVGGHIRLLEAMYQKTDQQQEVEMKQLWFHNRYYNRCIAMIEQEHYSVVFYTCLDRYARRILHRNYCLPKDCLRYLGH